VSVDRVHCVHCYREVRPDGRGGWVHLDGEYACRDGDHSTLPSTAEPAPPAGPPTPPEWPLNSAAIPERGSNR
jgi:hypothetical protein